jgi:hypothetical protein
MARKTLFENMVARFPEGTFARLDAALAEGENRANFVRYAVEQELKRRQRSAPQRQLRAKSEEALKAS